MLGVANQKRNNVRWVGNDWDANVLEALLDLGDVALLLLTIAEMLALVLDGGAGSRDGAWRKRGRLTKREEMSGYLGSGKNFASSQR